MTWPLLCLADDEFTVLREREHNNRCPEFGEPHPHFLIGDDLITAEIVGRADVSIGA
jgi:hypothetical protein